MAPICLPMNAFVRGETPLCFDIFPLDRNWGRRKEGTAVSLYCFYLSSRLRRFFFYLSSLKLNNKKALIFIIAHYYFQTKTSHQKNSELKEISRNVTWLHVWIQSEGKGQWERSQKYLWKHSFRWLRSIPLPTHTLISHYRSDCIRLPVLSENNTSTIILCEHIYSWYDTLHWLSFLYVGSSFLFQ